MKMTFIRLASLMALAFLAAPLMVKAQQPMLVDVPFAFTAGKVTLPAGQYVVKPATVDRGSLLIQRTDANHDIYVASFGAEKGQPQSQCELVFHRYGERYFLYQVWSAGSARGRELPKSDKEKEEILSARKAQEQVVIAARITPR